MDNKIENTDTGQNASQEPEWPAGLNSEGQPLPDPRLVEKLVEELKSQGKFDQIRNDCFAEVDTQVLSQFNVMVGKVILLQVKISLNFVNALLSRYSIISDSSLRTKICVVE